MKTITVIGVGNMGAPMADNLISSGYQVVVFDLNPSLTAPFKSRAKVALNTEDAVADSDCVITMLPAGEQVKSVYLGDENQHNGLFDIVEVKPC